jgi:hypothetical protein
MRAVSTVLDGVVFLLLVSGAVLIVTTATPVDPAPDRADETAALLATTTATVTYEHGGRAGHATEPNRTRGTVAELLARGAVASVTHGGRQVTARTTFPERVRGVVRSVTGPRTRVTAHWVPYEGASLSGRLAVGPRPPTTADLRVATLSVPVGGEESQDEPDTYRAVARQAAARTVALLVPVGEADLGVSGRVDQRVAALTGGRVGVPRAAAPGGRMSRVLERTERALAARYERELRETQPSPGAAAAAVRAGVVTVTVREWDA